MTGEVPSKRGGKATEVDLFALWCITTERAVRQHRLQVLESRREIESEAQRKIAEIIPGHYDDPSRIAERLVRLGFKKAATILRDRLPTSKRARSADLGEILATEYVNSRLPYRIPIRRLRWKDGRDVALRGDDLMGLRVEGNRLFLLKGEVKSRITLSSQNIVEARDALERHHGRPSPHTTNFVMDRLWEVGDDETALVLEQYLANRRIPTTQLVHLIFTFSQNNSAAFLAKDLISYKGGILQLRAGVVVTDHAGFVSGVFEEVLPDGTSRGAS